ncbi:MAG TPA: hypothetical protein VKT80_18515 [Chloroflexota bacterium]|nr:hypothetical protein [Chloroflexota bacterium]
MTKELKPIDISNSPEILRIVEEMRASNEPRVFRRDNEDVAILRPVKRAARRRVLRGRPTSADDPLWNIVGMAAGPDDGVTDVSTNKLKYLADAYADLHE